MGGGAPRSSSLGGEPNSSPGRNRSAAYPYRFQENIPLSANNTLPRKSHRDYLKGSFIAFGDSSLRHRRQAAAVWSELARQNGPFPRRH
jgi:hypothetical protein